MFALLFYSTGHVTVFFQDNVNPGYLWRMGGNDRINKNANVGIIY